MLYCMQEPVAPEHRNSLRFTAKYAIFFMLLSPYIQIQKQTKRMKIPRSQLKKKKKTIL